MRTTCNVIMQICLLTRCSHVAFACTANSPDRGYLKPFPAQNTHYAAVFWPLSSSLLMLRLPWTTTTWTMKCTLPYTCTTTSFRWYVFFWKYRIHKLFLREAPILSEEAVDQDNQVLCSSDRLLAVLQNKHGTSANSEGTSNRYPKRTSSALLYGTLLYAILLKELANFSRM